MSEEPTDRHLTSDQPAEGEQEGTPTADVVTPAQRAARRRRLAEVFGDVLPEQTKDDAEEPADRPDDGDEWLRRQVPPHHG